MRRRAAAVLLLLGVTTACTGSHAPRPAAEAHAAGLPATTPSDWRRALHVHHGGLLQPALPPVPPVDCSTQLCAEASDPVGPLWLRGDAHLDGGCVWGVVAQQGADSARITLIWPAGTYATFGRVIRVFDKGGKLLADSRRPFTGSGFAPLESSLPSRCLVNDRSFIALDHAAPEGAF